MYVIIPPERIHDPVHLTITDSQEIDTTKRKMNKTLDNCLSTTLEVDINVNFLSNIKKSENQIYKTSRQ